MELLISILTMIFIALVVGTALTFGVALLLWFLAMAALISAYMILRNALRRWRFIRNSAPPNVIEGDYRDISE